MIGLLCLPFHAPLAATVDQELDILLVISRIGPNVPEPYASELSVGDTLKGKITALNVDLAVDGVQGDVIMVDHMMTIAGVSFDRARTALPITDLARVEDGEVNGFGFTTGDAFGGVFPDLRYQLELWVLTFEGWSFTSPTGDSYQISGSYSVQPAVIPLPAALGLFGSAVIGLLGFVNSRQRR